MNFFEIEDNLHNLNNKITYTNEQSEFIDYNGNSSVVLSSVAGSGKTASCVGRMHKLLDEGETASKMIFFSFTTDAVEELKDRIDNDNIKVTTFHSFCYSFIAKNKRYRPVKTYSDFINWYKKNKKKDKKYASNLNTMFEYSDRLSGDTSTYKLNKAVNIKGKLPDFFIEYQEFLYKTKGCDFSDMIILAYKLLQDKEIRSKYDNLYEHIFIDEYQDTSVLQIKILLALGAKQYYLIGDKNQAIYNFSGNSYKLVEDALKENKEIVEFNLTKNFRSDINIVNNSNTYSSLTSIANSLDKGFINNSLIDINEIQSLLSDEMETAILCRTNSTIRHLEYVMLMNKVPLAYNNYITRKDVENWQDGDINGKLRNKIYKLLPVYGEEEDIFSFIETHSKSNKKITTIHKSKGREYDRVIVVNSLNGSIIENHMEVFRRYDAKELKKISFSPQWPDYIESRCIHYVAITRPKKELYYSFIDNNL